jgi:hypothetical protein
VRTRAAFAALCGGTGRRAEMKCCLQNCAVPKTKMKMSSLGNPCEVKKRLSLPSPHPPHLLFIASSRDSLNIHAQTKPTKRTFHTRAWVDPTRLPATAARRPTAPSSAKNVVNSFSCFAKKSNNKTSPTFPPHLLTPLHSTPFVIAGETRDKKEFSKRQLSLPKHNAITW